MNGECCILNLGGKADGGVHLTFISLYLLYNLILSLPCEQEDDEGEDGRRQDDLHLGVQTRLQLRAGDAAIRQS